MAPAGDGVIGKGELDQPDLAQRLGQVGRELIHRRLMITRERADDLLIVLGPVGSKEDPDPQLPRLDFRVVAIVQQHGLLDHVAGEPRPHLVIDLALHAIKHGVVHVRLPQSPVNPTVGAWFPARPAIIGQVGWRFSCCTPRQSPSPAIS